jgi:macrolide transport system ATP-binding/permease protein
MFNKLKLRLRATFFRSELEDELQSELSFHLEKEIEKNIAYGMSPEDARRTALRNFGGVQRVKEESRDERGVRFIEELWQDLRYSLRMTLRNPGLTFLAVLTLALGIGANLSIFSFVDTFFLRPLPARDPEQLISIEGGYAYPAYAFYRDHSKSFETLAAHYSTAPFNLVMDGDSSMVNGAVVSANYFPMLGLQPRLGRFFSPEEDAEPDRNPVVVIGERMWQDRFNGDPNALGKTLELNGVAFQIIGVVPAEFPGVIPGSRNELWAPTMMLRVGYRYCDALTNVDCRPLGILGRLRPGQSLTEAEAELNLLARQLAANIPTEQRRVIWLRRALGVRMNERAVYAYQMQLLMAVTGLLLVIACANVAGLLLARASARRKEIAIRLCIGAGRWRLARQFLTESLLLACAGGALGLVVSRWTTELLAAFYNSSGWQYDLRLSPRMVVYALALTLLTGILFGVLPALKAPAYDLVGGLKDDGGSRGPIHQRLRSALVVGQVALSLAILVTAGLLIRSESHVRAGANFDPQRVVALRVRPGLLRYLPERAQAYTHEVVRRLEATPGVLSVGVAAGTGLAWRSTGEISVRLPEQTPQRAEDQLRVEYQESGPRFCETLKIPLLAGREFNDGDRPGAPRVVVINETLARRLWPEDTALQQTLLLNDQPYRVVGVSKDALLRNTFEGELPFLYLPYWQNTLRPQVDARLLIRVAGDPQAMVPQLRRTIVGVDPQVPLSEVALLTEQISAEYKSVMLTSSVATWTGALAFLLSMLSLYGVLAFAVSQRRREIGVRMALGAARRDVLRLVIAQGLRLALAGVGIGLLAAYITTRLVKSLLYGVSATDPLTFAGIAAILLVVAIAASYLPARQATKVDPLVAFRSE